MQALGILQTMGLSDPADIGGLTLEELAALVPEDLHVAIASIWLTCGAARNRLVNRHAENPGLMRSLLPDQPPPRRLPMPPPERALRGRPPPGGNPLPPDDELQYKTILLDRLLVFLQLHGSDSPLWIEKCEADRSGSGATWLEAFRLSMTRAHEPPSLRKAINEWSRLISWVNDLPGEVAPSTAAAIPPLRLSVYLQSRERSGATAAQSSLQALRWLSRHLLVPFVLAHPLLSPFLSATPGHRVTPQEVLPVQAFGHMVDLSLPKEWDNVNALAALILRILVLGLRYAHVRRATIGEQDTSMTSWNIDKGKRKDKSGFCMAMPNFIAPNQPIFTKLDAWLRVRLGADADKFLMPDFDIPSLAPGQDLTEQIRLHSTVLPAHMSYGRFVDLFRHILAMPPLSMETDSLATMASYSLRRFMATAADSLDLPLVERYGLGGWENKDDKVMPLRYSAVRAHRQAQARRVCICATIRSIDSCRGTSAKPSFSFLSAQKTRIASIIKETSGPLWGMIDLGDLGDPPDLMSVVSNKGNLKRPRSPSHSSDSSSSGSDVDEDEILGADDFDDLEWVVPPRGLLHLVDEEWTPKCSSRRLTSRNGTEHGKGVMSARNLGRQWCPACVARSGAALAALILADSRVAPAAAASLVKVPTHSTWIMNLDFYDFADGPSFMMWLILVVGILTGAFLAFAVMRLQAIICNMARKFRLVRKPSSHYRTVATQAQTSYTRSMKLASRRFQPLADSDHGAWSD